MAANGVGGGADSTALCITGWSAISPFGIGAGEFTEAVTSRRAGLRPPAADFPVPLPLAGMIPEFQTKDFLGARGTRAMDRLTGMVVACADMILRQHDNLEGQERASLAMVLGTSTGSVASITDFLRDTFVQEKPYLVNPAAFPNTVMNCAAGQAAIWHRLRGVNSTIAAGQLSSLQALRYAARMVRRGHAETLLVGGVEELSVPVAWADHQMRQERLRDSRAPGEGCAMFLVEAAEVASAQGRAVLAEILDFAFQVQPLSGGDGGKGQRAALAGCIQSVLERSGVAAGDLHFISTAQPGGELDALEDDAIQTALAGAEPRRTVAVAHQIGNCFSASGAFQLAAVLALAGASGGGRERAALITSVGDDGSAGCVLVRA